MASPRCEQINGEISKVSDLVLYFSYISSKIMIPTRWCLWRSLFFWPSLSSQSPLWLGIGVKTSNIKMMIFFDTCFTEPWQWSILNIVYKVHPNLKAVCSTGHIGANRILLDLCWAPRGSGPIAPQTVVSISLKPRIRYMMLSFHLKKLA